MSGLHPMGSVIHGRDDDDHYRLIRPLGHGTHTLVYEAHDLRRGGRVALKLMSARDAAARARMQQEWDALRRLHHPSIVRALSFGVSRGAHEVVYLATVLLEGAPLRVMLDERPGLPLERAVAHGAELFDALSLAHKEGVVHRDVRPENLFIVRPAPHLHRLVLLDFGLACSSTARLPTAQGLMGHLRYAAPELFFGGVPSVASDLYAAGITLFEMLTGCHPLPVRGDDWRSAHSGSEPEPLEAFLPESPTELPLLLRALLAKHVRQRPPSARACFLRLRAIERETAVERAAGSPTADDSIDALLRRLGGPASVETTQVDPPSVSLLRRAGSPDDTEVESAVVEPVEGRLKRGGETSERAPLRETVTHPRA